jgi:hypothetical protein
VGRAPVTVTTFTVTVPTQMGPAVLVAVVAAATGRRDCSRPGRECPGTVTVLSRLRLCLSPPTSRAAVAEAAGLEQTRMQQGFPVAVSFSTTFEPEPWPSLVAVPPGTASPRALHPSSPSPWRRR